MIKIYHKDAGIRSVTGTWVFNTEKDAEPMIKSYEKSKRELGAELYDYIVEETDD